jgi:protein ImuA
VSTLKFAISLKASIIEDVFGCGLRVGVHEIYAPGTSHISAATGFAAALAFRAAAGKPILWVRQEFLDTETGKLNASGLAEYGLDSARIILVRTRDAEGALRAGEQAARCAALGAVVIEPWGEPKILDFTASRRLSLASAKSGVPILMLRAAVSPSHSAAATRWSVKASPSRALEANAPGFPAFELNLLRNRGGTSGQVWRVEWNRDRGCFQDWQRFDAAPVSRPLVSVSSDRPAASGTQIQDFRRTG